MSMDIRRLTPTDVPLMYALLRTFGEALNDVDSYSANGPSEGYLRRLLGGDTFVALAALKNGAVVDGFHAFAARTGDDSFRVSWPSTKYRDEILHLISFHSVGAKAQMRVFFDAAEGQARGTPPGELKRIIKERFRTGSYKAPERAGVSCMLSPILRTYVNPDEDHSVATANVPHMMYYTPHAPTEDIGGATPRLPPPMYPFVIMPRPHGYNIQLLGLTERAAINKEYEAMLAHLCQIKDVWCLPRAKG